LVTHDADVVEPEALADAIESFCALYRRSKQQQIALGSQPEDSDASGNLPLKKLYVSGMFLPDKPTDTYIRSRAGSLTKNDKMDKCGFASSRGFRFKLQNCCMAHATYSLHDTG
jgi:hypothetical protein